MSRFTSEVQRNGLKTHLRRIHAALGGIDAAASCTRVVRSKLAEYADVNRPDRHIPIDVLLDLEMGSGQPFVTEFLAGAQGYVLLPMHVGDGDLAEALAKISQVAGKTMGDAIVALRDEMPPAEKQVVLDDLAELAMLVNRALGTLRGGAVVEIDKGSARQI